MTPHERKARTRDWLILVFLAALLVVAAVAAISALVALGTASDTADLTRQNARTLKRIEQVRAASRDQTCTLFERQEKTSVREVHNTYAYLEGLDLKDYGTSITRAIIQRLPQLRQDAKAARAPQYCNLPGVGLPEPGRNDCRRLLPSCLKLPPHRDFRVLLRPSR